MTEKEEYLELLRKEFFSTGTWNDRPNCSLALKKYIHSDIIVGFIEGQTKTMQAYDETLNKYYKY